MTAGRKTFPEQESEAGELNSPPAPRPEAACAERHDGSHSPARQLQDDLQTRFSATERSSKFREIAQTLITASGLTMVMGIILFNAIS